MSTLDDDARCLDIHQRPWPIELFVLSVSVEPYGPLSSVDMCSFMSDKDHLDHTLQQDIMLDEKLYFPPCFRKSTKVKDSTGQVVKTKSNLPPYLNEESCYNQGYCVRPKDWKNQ